MGFTETEWATIDGADWESFDLPTRNDTSVVLATFNVLKLGSGADGAKRWSALRRICERFDFIAVQEISDDLSGVRRLRSELGADYSMVVSDSTGRFPGDPFGLSERLAFIYRNDRFHLDELVSDISYDRSRVTTQLYSIRTGRCGPNSSNASKSGKGKRTKRARRPLRF